MSQTHYKSDIKLGDRYRDAQTGFEGVATSIYFFQFACERVSVETYDETRREVKIEIFDAPRLVHLETNKRATSSRPGGPARAGEGARPIGSTRIARPIGR